MIAIIEGEVIHLAAPVACIMTKMGVGYEVELPLQAFCQLSIDTPAKLWTHLHVREDAQLLYGFITRTDREAFRQLIRINGVGAKMALAMMSTMSVSELKQNVESDNELALTKVPGVGKKTAQRLLIELKGKFDHVAVDGLDLNGSNISTNTLNGDGVVIAEVESALQSLGYKDKEAQLAIKAAQEDATISQPFNTQALLKLTLKKLSGF